KERGFSDSIIDRFFRPFFGGVFLESNLASSSRKFEFLFQMFSQANAALPSAGMEELARQLAEKVGLENIRFNARVQSLSKNAAILEGGEYIQSRSIVVAVEGAAIHKLLPDFPAMKGEHASTCLYFSCDQTPVNEPILVLNGDGAGPINNLCFPSKVSSEYAPEGKHLASVSVLGSHTESNEILEHAVRSQLIDWFGGSVSRWKLLSTYKIKHALPAQLPPTDHYEKFNPEIRPGIFVCGDHVSTGSINGALESGRKTAERISSSLFSMAAGR
ncbi:MAG: FAD-dependent oxidoreductase, partial [Candidatus Obscuribacterales bacterium]|nr:FAD-dependent oxidoreductase [Candidatus Obscuribacterales bacterium]